MKDIITLAVESSCDETSVAVLKNGREVLSNIINTQVDLHKKFGGVVPEVASRKHIYTPIKLEKDQKKKIITVTYHCLLVGSEGVTRQTWVLKGLSSGEPTPDWLLEDASEPLRSPTS